MLPSVPYNCYGYVGLPKKKGLYVDWNFIFLNIFIIMGINLIKLFG